MPDITGPFMALSAGGSLGPLTAQKHRRSPYIRNKPTPANPKTSAQTAVRSALADLTNYWAALDAELRALITTIAAKGNKTPLNHWLSDNLTAYEASAPSPDFILTRGSPSTIPPALTTVRDSNWYTYVTFTFPTPPPGLTYSRCIAISMRLDNTPGPTRWLSRSATSADPSPATALIWNADSWSTACWGILEYSTPTGVKRYSPAVKVAIPYP